MVEVIWGVIWVLGCGSSLVLLGFEAWKSSSWFNFITGWIWSLFLLLLLLNLLTLSFSLYFAFFQVSFWPLNWTCIQMKCCWNENIFEADFHVSFIVLIPNSYILNHVLIRLSPPCVCFNSLWENNLWWLCKGFVTEVRLMLGVVDLVQCC